MALRVLLADESSSIKRVMELALQDYAVEVKPVFLGPDVLNIAKQFKPDIIFVDVLLQKLSGYEVARALKNAPELSAVPSVLMWSGFMEFDEQKFKHSMANAKLEKPFTSEQLRKTIRDLVVKTSTQNLADFIHLPEIIESLKLEPRVKPAVREETVLNLSEATSENSVEAWNMESFAPIESFAGPTTSEDESWVQTNLNKFKVPEPKTDDEFLAAITPAPKEKDREKTKEKIKEQPAPQKIFAEPQLTEADLEPIIRKQAKEMIDSIIWKIVPDMAERIIKEEIQRLIHEKDSPIQLD